MSVSAELMYFAILMRCASPPESVPVPRGEREVAEADLHERAEPPAQLALDVRRHRVR